MRLDVESSYAVGTYLQPQHIPCNLSSVVDDHEEYVISISPRRLLRVGIVEPHILWALRHHHWIPEVPPPQSPVPQGDNAHHSAGKGFSLNLPAMLL